VNRFIKIPIILGLTTFLASGLLILSELATHDKIAQQKKTLLLKSLELLIPSNLHDNDLTESTIQMSEPDSLGHRESSLAYVGLINNEISAIALPVTSHSGYSGDIDLMVGIKANGQITSVKIIEQHETPGLGDLVLETKSNWIHQFPGTSLNVTEAKAWAVKKDGGVFDQITGATITPRAIVTAIQKALQYHQNNKQNYLKMLDKNLKAKATMSQSL
jgi:electron transport complex protein RnfG